MRYILNLQCSGPLTLYPRMQAKIRTLNDRRLTALPRQTFNSTAHFFSGVESAILQPTSAPRVRPVGAVCAEQLK